MTFAWIGVESFCLVTNFCLVAWLHLPGYCLVTIHQSVKSRRRSKAAQVASKGTQKTANGAPGTPKGSQREPKVAPKGRHRDKTEF